MIIDSHCHLNFSPLKEELPAVLARAHQADVKIMQTICTELAEFDEINKIAQDNEGVYCSVGVHPNHVEEGKVATVEQLIELTGRDRSCLEMRFFDDSSRKSVAEYPSILKGIRGTEANSDNEIAKKSQLLTVPKKVIGIGETGLDYYHKPIMKELQKESFINHIKAAQQTKLPLIVHTRDAEQDMTELLATQMKAEAFKGVLHCFTGTKEFAYAGLDLGLYISISGIVTFKNARELQEVVKILPLNRLLVETDAPFLAPQAVRGQTNEPAYTKYVVEFLGELFGKSESYIADVTTQNFLELFDKVDKL